MADETPKTAKTSLIFDASGATKGAEEAKAAADKIIAANAAVERSTAKVAEASTAAQAKMGAVNKAASQGAQDAARLQATAAGVGSDAIAKATARNITSLSSQTKFIDSLTRSFDPLEAAAKRASGALSTLIDIQTRTGAPGASEAAQALNQRAGALMPAVAGRALEAQQATMPGTEPFTRGMEELQARLDPAGVSVKAMVAELRDLNALQAAGVISSGNYANAWNDIVEKYEEGTVAAKKAAAAQREVNESARAAQTATNAQAQINQLTGVQTSPGTVGGRALAPATSGQPNPLGTTASASESAAAFEAAFTQQKNLSDVMDRLTAKFDTAGTQAAAMAADIAELNAAEALGVSITGGYAAELAKISFKYDNGASDEFKRLSAIFDTAGTAAKKLQKDLDDLNAAQERGVKITGGYDAARANIMKNDPAVAEKAALIKEFKPLVAVTEEYNAALLRVDKAEATTIINDKEAATQKVRLKAILDQQTASVTRYGSAHSQADFATRQFGVQSVQFFTSLQAGQPFLTAFIQQAHQVLDVALATGTGFGVLGKAVKVMFTEIYKFVAANPIIVGILAISSAFVALGVAAEGAARRHLLLQTQLSATRSDTVKMSKEVEDAAREAARHSDLSTTTARTTGQSIASVPNFVGTTEQLRTLILQANSLAKILNVDVATAAKHFTDAMRDPAKVAAELSSGEHPLKEMTIDVVAHIKSLVSLGKNVEAVALLLKTLGDAADKQKVQLTPLQEAWNKLSERFVKADDAAGKVYDGFMSFASMVRGLDRVVGWVFNFQSALEKLSGTIGNASKFSLSYLFGLDHVADWNTLATLLQSVMDSLKNSIPTWDSLASSMKPVTDAFKFLGDAIARLKELLGNMPNPADWIKSALGKMVGADLSGKKDGQAQSTQQAPVNPTAHAQTGLRAVFGNLFEPAPAQSTSSSQPPGWMQWFIDQMKDVFKFPTMPQTTTSGGTGGGTGSGTIGDRLNNPMNLTALPGQAAEGVFRRFSTMEEGVSAAVRQLQINQDTHGVTTLAGQIQRWAPPNENDTAGYIRRVSKETGIDPNAPLNTHDAAVIKQVVTSMIGVEIGHTIPADTVSRGVDAAMAGSRPVTVEPPKTEETTKATQAADAYSIKLKALVEDERLLGVEHQRLSDKGETSGEIWEQNNRAISVNARQLKVARDATLSETEQLNNQAKSAGELSAADAKVLEIKTRIAQMRIDHPDIPISGAQEAAEVAAALRLLSTEYEKEIKTVDLATAQEEKLNIARLQGAATVRHVAAENEAYLKVLEKFPAGPARNAAQQELTARLERQKVIQAQGTLAPTVVQNTLQAETYQKETAALGMDADARVQYIAGLQAEQTLKLQGLPINDNFAKSLIESAKASADAAHIYQKSQQDIAEVSGMFSSSFDAISNAITQSLVNGTGAAVNFRNVMTSVAQQILSQFLKLSVLNPLMNSIFKTDLPTVGSVFKTLQGLDDKKAANDNSSTDGVLSAAKQASSLGGTGKDGGPGFFERIYNSVFNIKSATAGTAGVGGLGDATRSSAFGGEGGTWDLPGQMTEAMKVGAESVTDAVTEAAPDLTEAVASAGKDLGDAVKDAAPGFANIFTSLLGSSGSGGSGGGIGGSLGDIGGIVGSVGKLFASGGAATAAAAVPEIASGIGGAIGSLGSAGGSISGLTSLLAVIHQGGVVGPAYSGPTRRVDSSILANAPRLHEGLANDEYPAILQRGERVLTAQQNTRFETIIKTLTEASPASPGPSAPITVTIQAANGNAPQGVSDRVAAALHGEIRAPVASSSAAGDASEARVPAMQFHGGGLVGRDGVPVSVPASVLVNLPRFHEGLGGDEFAAILQKGEKVLTTQQQQAVAHAANSNAPPAAAPMTLNFNFPANTSPDSFRRAGQQVANNVSVAIDRAKSRNGGR